MTFSTQRIPTKIVWALAFLIGLLTPLMPLALFILGFVVILAGLWALWRTVASWFWFGM